LVLDYTDVTPENVDREGFFCYMSKRKTEGHSRKLDWVKARLDEGMRIKIALNDSRAFIEYIPGEHCWRAIEADGYMVVHCIWVVGKKRHGQGHGSFLLGECVEDAEASGMKGVCAVTSSRPWAADKGLFERNGFVSVAQEEPFDLMVNRFEGGPEPRFAGGWEDKARKCGEGLTILRTDQCPYIEDSTNSAVENATEMGFKSEVVEISSRDEVMERMPYPYGTFAMVLDGERLSYTYQLPKDFKKMLGGYR
jgi:L-amino acid N-acyltransferase YncA